MFTIIGGDGKEYGPVPVSQIRAWLIGGRANLETKARAVGTDEWRTLNDFPEFNESLRSAPPPMTDTDASTPPPFPETTPRTTFTPYSSQPYATPAAGAVDQTEYADRGARTGAALLNAMFYFFSLMPSSVYYSQKLLAQNPDLKPGTFPRAEDLDLTGLEGAQVWASVSLLVALLLQAILIYARGQNLGKLACGGRVVRADTGEPAGFLRGVLMRFFLPVAIILFLNSETYVLGWVFLVVDFCFMFRADHRCLHDLMAGTKVVKK